MTNCLAFTQQIWWRGGVKMVTQRQFVCHICPIPLPSLLNAIPASLWCLVSQHLRPSYPLELCWTTLRLVHTAHNLTSYSISTA
uniref:Uncharacterized protein n=1 Tax=Anguilla anguilla TaxID=7936 RepID=A0A0E9WCU6_ANGAN